MDSVADEWTNPLESMADKNHKLQLQTGGNAGVLLLLFRHYDYDLSGQIDFAEFAHMCSSLGIAPSGRRLEDMYRAAARMGTREAGEEETPAVDFTNFCAWYAQLPEGTREDVVSHAVSLQKRASLVAGLSAPALQVMTTWLANPIAMFRPNTGVGAFDTILSDLRVQRHGGYFGAAKAVIETEGVLGVRDHLSGAAVNALVGVVMFSTHSWCCRALHKDNPSMPPRWRRMMESSTPLSESCKLQAVAGAAAGFVQGVLNTPMRTATENLPSLPAVRALVRTWRGRGGWGMLRGWQLMAAKDALGTSLFFSSFDAARVSLVRTRRRKSGDTLRLADVRVGDGVFHEGRGGGEVTDVRPDRVRVRYSRTGACHDHSAHDLDQGWVTSQNRSTGLFWDRYAAPLMSGTFAGTVFIAVTHPFDRLREYQRLQPSAPTAWDAMHASGATAWDLRRGIVWKLPNAVLVGLPLLVYSFSMYRMPASW
eukprot:TRINITY_DN44324_c0_g1_i1.p1 TRINITY_DN44324_c0_g1~~TRINITY_DN44324_c0_g1_i1.p1  ORF type:complete len:481 (+),score=127.13 TRINITY_DN44324_c0_g1_i1:60-1502(+)